MINRPFKIYAANFSCFRGIALLATVLSITGCASTRPPEPGASAPPPAEAVAEDVPPSPDPSPPAFSSVEADLRAEIENWQGTPHRWGGITTSGADCSGFVYSVYRDLFSVSLPRTTGDQVRVGRSVDVGQLRAGDLVFFRPSKRTNHVGIYLSDGRFAHISTSRGLMFSHLDEEYWRRAYWTSRRVLPGEGNSSAPEASQWEPASAPSHRTRGGW